MPDEMEEFNEFREKMNKRILNSDNLNIKRFFNLDHNVYKEGVLDTKTKEMMGLVSSLVLRCDDCIKYHIDRCHKEGVTEEEFFEVFSVALVVGGSIVIPHLRRAVNIMDNLQDNS